MLIQRKTDRDHGVPTPKMLEFQRLIGQPVSDFEDTLVWTVVLLLEIMLPKLIQEKRATYTTCNWWSFFFFFFSFFFFSNQPIKYRFTQYNRNIQYPDKNYFIKECHATRTNLIVYLLSNERMIKSIAARLCLTLVTTDVKILCLRQHKSKIFKNT